MQNVSCVHGISQHPDKCLIAEVRENSIFMRIPGRKIEKHLIRKTSGLIFNIKTKVITPLPDSRKKSLLRYTNGDVKYERGTSSTFEKTGTLKDRFE